MEIIKDIESKQKKNEFAAFRVGDVVDVQTRITEGEKERIQTFTGTVISMKGTGIRKSFTVRRIVAGEGVERVFPLHAPVIANVIVRRPGKARRAKLYYLRDRVGKATKTKERRVDPPPKKKKKKASKAAKSKAEKSEEPVTT